VFFRIGPSLCPRVILLPLSNLFSVPSLSIPTRPVYTDSLVSLFLARSGLVPLLCPRLNTNFESLIVAPPCMLATSGPRRCSDFFLYFSCVLPAPPSPVLKIGSPLFCVKRTFPPPLPLSQTYFPSLHALSTQAGSSSLPVCIILRKYHLSHRFVEEAPLSREGPVSLAGSLPHPHLTPVSSILRYMRGDLRRPTQKARCAQSIYLPTTCLFDMFFFHLVLIPPHLDYYLFNVQGQYSAVGSIPPSYFTPSF